MSLTLTPIAHIRTDFGSKFGVPRQSGVVPELTATIVFTPEDRNPDALRGIEDFPTYGSCGTSLRSSKRAGPPRYGRPGWAATPAWGCSPPAPPIVPTPSAYPASSWWR